MKILKITIVTALSAALFAVFAAALFAFSAGGAISARAAGGELRVHFIDCGQADSCYIELPDGKNMLIDAGDSDKESYTSVLDYLEKQNVETLDYFIMTHSDDDHIGGADNVLEAVEVKTIYRPHQEAVGTKANPCEDPAADRSGKYGFYAEVEEKATKVYGEAITAAYAETYTENGETHKAEVYVTNPFDDEINHIEGDGYDYMFDFYSPVDVAAYSDSNDFSPIMVLSYAQRDFVLTGDAEKANEADFVDLVKTAKLGDYGGHYDRFIDRSFSADVIKMGHHGSETSSSEAFLEIVAPTESYRRNIFTVFSCGAGNSYGHPHAGTIERLIKDMSFSAERIERTDLNGDIVFGVSAEGAFSLYEEKTDVTIAQKLTSGRSDSRDEVTIADNDIDPDEPVGALPTVTEPDSGMPDLFDPDTWKRSPLEWHPLQWVIIAAAVVVIVAIVAFSVRGAKKRRKRR